MILLDGRQTSAKIEEEIADAVRAAQEMPKNASEARARVSDAKDSSFTVPAKDQAVVATWL